MLLTLALAACGGGLSEADIEATVVARIEEKQAEDATLEAIRHIPKLKSKGVDVRL